MIQEVLRDVCVCVCICVCVFVCVFEGVGVGVGVWDMQYAICYNSAEYH